MDEWRRLFELSDRHGFISQFLDECCAGRFISTRTPRRARRARSGAAVWSQRISTGGIQQSVKTIQRSRHAFRFAAGDASILKEFLPLPY